jgi:hypothetical protein
MAQGLAIVHPRNRRLVTYIPLALRKQHGHPQALVRGDFRFLGRANDTSKDESIEAEHVRRVRRDLQPV